MRMSPTRRRILKLFLLLATISFIPYLLMSPVREEASFPSTHVSEQIWPRPAFDKPQWTKSGGPHDIAGVSNTIRNKFTFSKLPSKSSTIPGTFKSSILQRDARVPFNTAAIPDKRMLRESVHGSRMMQYCNSPMEETVGEEGIHIKGHKLRMVHVFTRHGDRASIHHVSGFKPRGLDCKIESLLGISDEKVRTFLTRMKLFIGKQPAKSHFMNWALFPNRQDCKASELSARGVLQHIKLGKFLQNRYMNVSNIFVNSSDMSPEILTFSTSASRTYQSAIALLYGFLPLFNLTQLRIEFASNAYFCSEKFSLQKNCVCRQATNLLLKSRQLASIGNSNSPLYSSIKNIISETFEINAKLLPWMTGIMDAFAPSMCHSLSVPCSSTSPSRCINSTVIDTMWSEIVRSQQEVLNDPEENHLKFSSIMMYPVLAEMTSRMVKLTEGKHTPRFVLHSGHDLTITPLLHVLGVHDGMWPPYASRVVIELYSTDSPVDTSSEYFVRILYNGDDVTSKLPFCKLELQMCSLKSFVQFVYRDMMQRFGFTNLPSACSRPLAK